MRLFILALVMILCTTAIAQDRAGRKKALFEPLPAIPVVKLDRKERVDYDKEIRPILEAKCLYCHSGGIKEGRYDMDSHADLIKGGKTGVAIVPGKPDSSFFFKLAGRTGVPPMPPKDDEALTPQELALLRIWIEQGATGPTTAGAAAVKPAPRLRPLPASLRTVTALTLSAQSDLLAVGQAGRIMLLDATTGAPVRTLVNDGVRDEAGQPLGLAQWDQVHALAFSPDGKVLAAAGFQEVVLWEVASGKQLRKLGGFQDRVLALDFSPDGQRLAAAGGPPAGEAELKLFAWREGTAVFAAKAPHSDTIYAVRFRPDGTRLATAGADRFVRVFDASSGQLERSFEGHTQAALGVDWRADGLQLVSVGADQTLKVWDFQTGDQVRTVAVPGGEPCRLLVLKNQPWAVVTGNDGQVRIFDVNSGRQVRSLERLSGAAFALAAKPDGSAIMVGGQEASLRFYSGADSKLAKTVPVPAK